MRTALFVLALAASALGQRGTGPAGPPPAVQRPTESVGSLDFLALCGNCHGRDDKAPPIEILQKLTPEKIYESMTTGTMKDLAATAPDATKVRIAEWIGGRKLGLGVKRDAHAMTNGCKTHPPVRPTSAQPAWNGWSADAPTNRRFQDSKSAGITADSAARLELKWAFGLPGATSAYGQPTIHDGRVFIGSDSAYLYSLDAATGCVHWSFQAQSGLRSTPMIGPARPGSSRAAAFFGDIRGNVYSVDASTGELLWKVSADSHPMARVTAGVKLHNGRVYVSLASMEEPGSGGYDYDCCTSRGSVVALDAATGRQLWKTYTISETPTRRKTSTGVSFMGPSGAGVWGPVTLDVKRRAVYVSTGNAFSAPDVGRSDAVIAMHMDTGKILWVRQVEQGDVWHSANCRGGPPPSGFPSREGIRTEIPGRPAPPFAAPPIPPEMARRQSMGTGERPAPPPHYYCAEEPNAPDWDFAAGVMLVDVADGKSLVVAAQKSGVVWAFDPDKHGELVWFTNLRRGPILFGGAADSSTAYFGTQGAVLAAVRLQDGAEQWAVPVRPRVMAPRRIGISAAVTAIPGVVFAAGMDGTLRAFSAADGSALWQYDTTQPVQTVNGIPGTGGSIGSAGPAVVNGMVYVTSGYIGLQGGQPGNLLLAFGPRAQ